MERNVQSTVTGALNDFQAIWRNWANYGLTVGKAALETSAKTLETTAARLNEWSVKLEVADVPAEEKAAPEADVSEAPVVETEEAI